ncbi:subtilisin-like protein [Mycena vitilis]|nr:subtilisin-like protein [Mycena vitilis]
MALRKVLYVLALTAAASEGKTVLHERRVAAPAGFIRVGAAPGSEVVSLRVALAANDVAGLRDKLMSIATPGSSDFRQWLSMEEVKAYTQPSPETVSAFNAFASANGLKPTVISPNGDWVSIALPISQANTLFDAQFEIFSHPDMPGNITRTLSVSLPAELVGHVDVIHPTTAFTEPDVRLVPVPAVGRLTRDLQLRRASVDPSCDSSVPTGLITPKCLQDLYGIPATPATAPNNTILVTGYEGQFAQAADLKGFLEAWRPDIPANTTFSLLSVDGGINTQSPTSAGGEANLDIQYVAGIATGVPVQYLSVGGNFSATALLDTTTFLDGVANPPTVVTTSYALTESFFGNTLATKICNGYMALGSRGISVIFASGDGGVRGNRDTTNGIGCANNTFNPTFPPSCPFGTTVGGTIGFNPEVAVNFSTGGFSDFFPAPDYQRAAIAGFLETLPSDFAGIFNRTGRGFPDVALQAWNFATFNNGINDTTGGTSASAPTFAAIVALINDRLIVAGKPVLGFLNPFLYSTASGAFTDITSGHNSGFHCPANTTVAFDGAVGWDPLTGFGTPIFSELLAAALA